MAARRPLVNIAGSLQELPVGDTVIGATGGGGGGPSVAKFVIVGALSAGALTARWYPDREVTLGDIYFSLGTVPANSAVIDVQKNGTSIFSGARPTCSAGQNKSTTVTVSTVLTTSDYLTVFVNAASGADATLCIVYS